MMHRNDDRAGVKLEPNLQDPDGFFEELLAAHEGLGTEQSFELNARLLMLLANQVGDRAVISRCIELARAAGRKPVDPAPPADHPSPDG
jgi:hypothetical protein